MDSKDSTSGRRPLVAAGVAGAALLVGLLYWWWSRPPQLGTDEETSRTVDALFTAVTARDEKRVTDCEQRLHALRDAGRLPDDASDYLDGIIHKARAGEWEPAAKRLYAFVRQQRREGPSEHRRQEQARPTRRTGGPTAPQRTTP